MPEADPTAFARVYTVEILYESPPSIDAQKLLRTLQSRRPGVEPLGGPEASAAWSKGDGKALGFVHADHEIALKDAKVHPQTCLLRTDRPFQISEELEPAFQQSWSFPEARDVVAKARTTLLLTDLMSSPLDYQTRLELFEEVLAVVLEAAPAPAIRWLPSGRFVSPKVWLEAFDRGASDRLLAGAVNVRFVTISNSPGDMLMDTLGLAALGVPDLQCHFRDLDPNAVAMMLANTACYLFEHGDIIKDGQTVEGISPVTRWKCQHEDSLLGPKRIVLDVNPGPPHAAGGRG